MIPDGQLLRRDTETNSESAFTELVERHLALVYSAALRQVNGDAHLAQDVAQTVFADLARKAASLAGRPGLTGWLYTSTVFAAAKAVRTEQRRHTREQEAHLMNQLLGNAVPDPDWEKLRPVLDAAMLALNEADREAVLLRYFDNRPHAAIAERLGLTENATRMKVERALEKLRALLTRRGVRTTAALSAVISATAVQVAPAGLAATLSTAALAGTTLAATTTATAIKTVAMTTLQKALIAATLVAAVGTGIYEARQASRLRSQVQTLRAQQAEQLMREREEAASELAGLRAENEQLKRNAAELLKLRAETTRLRGELKRAELVTRNKLEAERSQSVTEKNPSNPPPVETYSATARAVVPWNQALITGGWKTLSGKIVYVLAVPTRTEDAAVVVITAHVMEVSVAAATKLGLDPSNTGEKETRSSSIRQTERFETIVRVAKNTNDVVILDSPRVTISTGNQAGIQSVVNLETRSGEKYSVGPTLNFAPTISSDGQSVDLAMVANVNYPSPSNSP